jgi:hypothetical protein
MDESGAGSSGKIDEPGSLMELDTLLETARKFRDDLPGRGRFCGNGVLYTVLENTGS